MKTMHDGAIPAAPSPIEEPPIESEAYLKIARRIVPFLFACYLASYLDRVNVGFAKLEMLADLKLSETTYGLGAGIFFLGYVLFELPSNMIMYRVGARVWISLIMFVWGIISASTMLVSSANTFYALRFLLGVAEAGFIPAVLYYLTHWFPAGRRAKVMALFFTAIPAAGIVGGPLSGWISHSLNGLLGILGWKWLFLLEAVPSLVLGLSALGFLDDQLASVNWLTAEQKRVVGERIREEAGKTLHSFFDGLTHKTVWIMSTTYFFLTMGLYGVSFWLPSLIKASGVTDVLNVGLLTAAPYLLAAAGMVLVARSSDLHGERRWHLVIPCACGAIGLVLSVSTAHNPPLAILTLSLATTGIITTISQFWTLQPAILQGAAAAAGIAVINSIGGVAGFVSPYLIGWMKDITGSTNHAVEILAVSLIVGAVVSLAIPIRDIKRQI